MRPSDDDTTADAPSGDPLTAVPADTTWTPSMPDRRTLRAEMWLTGLASPARKKSVTGVDAPLAGAEDGLAADGQRVLEARAEVLRVGQEVQVVEVDAHGLVQAAVRRRVIAMPARASRPSAGPTASQGSTAARPRRSASPTMSRMLAIEMAKPRLLVSVSTLPTWAGGALRAVRVEN